MPNPSSSELSQKSFQIAGRDRGSGQGCASGNELESHDVHDGSIGLKSRRNQSHCGPSSPDAVPGAVSLSAWRLIELGLAQRAQALNEFLRDIHFGQRILNAGALPLSVVSESAAYLPQMIGFEPPRATYFHAVSFEVACVGGNFQVLSQDLGSAWECLRIPRMRESFMRSDPAFYEQAPQMNSDSIPEAFRDALEKVAVAESGEPPSIWVLSLNENSSGDSAERHAANAIGTGALRPGDIEIDDGRIAARTVGGLAPVDVLLRLSPKSLLDPLMFEGAAGGVPGLMDLYRSGKLAILAAPGAGIVDELAVFSRMPEIIEFYTGSAPILRNAPHWRCGDKAGKRFVLDNLHDLDIFKANDAAAEPLHSSANATAARTAALEETLKAEGNECIALETSPESRFPRVAGMPSNSSEFVLRAYAAGTAAGYSVLPGGAALPTRAGHATQSAERDLWILDE